ncbi:MAG: hypothetical protein MJA82_10945 [Clostridia bacterium]|nr:hypothetical protein [Clostridia bacterium]
MKRKFITVLMTLLLSLSFLITGFASGNDDPWRTEFIEEIGDKSESIDIIILSGGNDDPW